MGLHQEEHELGRQRAACVEPAYPLCNTVAAQNTAMLEQFFIEPQVRRKWSCCRAASIPRSFARRRAVLALRQQLGISPETVLVGTVAHLVPVKGLKRSLRRFLAFPVFTL